MLPPAILRQLNSNASKVKDVFLDCFVDVVNEDKDDIIQYANEVYSNLLNGRVYDRNSKIIAENYQEDFILEMTNYVYVARGGNKAYWSCPDMTDFPFNKGQLPCLKTILEGIPYTAVEIPHVYYEKLTGKKVLNQNPFDSSVAISDRIYIEKRTNKIIANAKAANITLAPYAYSGMSPVDIFVLINEYMWSKHDEWIEKTQQITVNKFK